MTTRVTIFNHGPDDVVVKTRGPDGKERLGAVLLRGSPATDFYVHAYQALVVYENSTAVVPE